MCKGGFFSRKRSPGPEGAGLSLSKKAGAAGLFRQDTFPLRLGRGRGNVQGNLAAQGFRTRRTCRRVRMAVGGLRPSKPPQRGYSKEAACSRSSRRTCRRCGWHRKGLPPLPASPQRCARFVDTRSPGPEGAGLHMDKIFRGGGLRAAPGGSASPGTGALDACRNAQRSSLAGSTPSRRRVSTT